MSVRILVGDCLVRLKDLPDASVDSVVCDPPYHLTSIHKRFAKTGGADRKPGTDQYGRLSRGFMGQTWDGGDVAFREETWAEVLRVLKPGGHLIAFSGTRTYHRMAVAIEDAGFEIRDQLAWVFGSGFPKSHDVGDGWGTALKPAWEPICLARKPLIGTVAKNMAAHGVGAINIDACRIFGEDEAVEREGEASQETRYAEEGATDFAAKPGRRYRVKRTAPGATQNATGKTKLDGVFYEGEMKPGRWPANLVHDGSDEVVTGFPAEAGAAAPVHRRNADKFRGTYGAFQGNVDEAGSTFHADSGSGARFFYCAKATTEERGDGNNHPTVKPVALMRWLTRLVTPKGGTVLDPFMGSGSTGLACDAEQFDFIGCELSADYAAIAEKRIHDAAGMFADVSIEHAGPATRAA